MKRLSQPDNNANLYKNIADPVDPQDAATKSYVDSHETMTNQGALINGATAKTTPVDADMVGLMDSAASNILKKLSWANIKAAWKTYFDTLYATSGHNHSGVYQPADSDLDTWATKTAPSGTVLGTTDTQAVTNKDITSATNTFASVTTTASSSTPTPTGDARENELYVTALATNATIAAPTGTPTNGNKLTIRIKDNGTARTLGWNAIFRVISVTLPTTTVISKTMYISAKYNSTNSKWDVLAVGQEA